MPASAVQIGLVDQLVRLSGVEWQPDVDGIHVRELMVDGRRWALVRYGAGAQRQEWCEDGHFGVVLAGAIEYSFEDGGTPLAARQGDAFTLSTGRGHRGRNPGTTETILLVIDDPA